MLYVIFEMHVREDRDFTARVAELQRVDKELSCNAVANRAETFFVVALPHLLEGKDLVQAELSIQLFLGFYLEEVVVLTAIDGPANDEIIVVIAIDPAVSRAKCNTRVIELNREVDENQPVFERTPVAA